MSRANDGPSKQTYGTPPLLLAAIRAKFDVPQWDFDLACDENNCIAPMGFMFDQGQDALLQDWSELEGLHAFLNPPFAYGKEFSEKVAKTIADGRAPKVYALYLASLGSAWFAKNVRPYATSYVLTGRVKFVGQPQVFDRDLVVCAYDGVEREHPIDVWDWRV